DSHSSNGGSMKADNGLGGRVRGIGFGSFCGESNNDLPIVIYPSEYSLCKAQ
ncbi:10562_t:CDS:2, partial [Gigaspora rosea]